jgi:hypothetical protein
MKVCPVPVDIKLGDDQLIDIFMVQWHTPMPARGHTPTRIPTAFVQQKQEILRQFQTWLMAQPAGNPVRPAFVIIPELSMPTSQIQVLEDLVHGMQRPIVVVAGMEYQSWADYQRLVQALPDMPDPQSWLEDGQFHNWVNAARIWIREENGQIKSYVQPKRHPQADEQAIPLYSGKNVLVFRSSTQADGRHMNFLIQVCSDFTNVASVRELRQQVAVKCEGLRIDFTILLQMNEDQDAEQFKQAVKEYFEPPNLLVHTEDGSLLFVNNASERRGKSLQWGDSRFHFSYQRSWPAQDFTPPTYWMRKDSPNNYQAVAFRERGPGIYWVRYKPHYLVSRAPGGPQLVPFSDTHALVASIEANHLGAGVPPNIFVAIPAVCHWLFSEWHEGHSDLASSLQENQTPDVVANHYVGSYVNGIEEWRRAIGGRDEVARSAINIYFECWKGDVHPRFPDTEVEPLEWGPVVRQGVKCMMNIYGLLKMGDAGLPGSNLYPHPEGVSHGISGDQLQLTFLWGGGYYQPNVMTVRYLAARKTRGAADLLCRKALLILLQPSGRISVCNLAQDYGGNSDDITEGTAISGIAKPGDVVAVPIPELKWMYAEDLAGQVSLATSAADLESRLTDVVRSVFR